MELQAVQSPGREPFPFYTRLWVSGRFRGPTSDATRCSCLLSCALVFSGITQIGVYGLWPPVEATRGQLEHTCKCAAFTAPHSVKIDVVL
eukprot:scaffold64111_cov69-Phaeocystis_antarctica.AAC.1